MTTAMYINFFKFILFGNYCRGYVVTPFGQDGFAILKKERIIESISDESYFPTEEEPDI